jgi:glycosyltransferase involved in cell wall biosynthesis
MIDRLQRLDAIALEQADEVVVCSPALAVSRGAKREVTLVPNGVDSAHFQRPQPRPRDMPPALTAVYVGTLHDSRLDVELVIELAQSLRQVSVVLVGPDALPPATRRRLHAEPNIHALGSRPYTDIPAYLQHADVIIMPHLVTPFTDSLDPIKAYECLVVNTPTVATPVAGFRELSRQLTIVAPESFVEAVSLALRTVPQRPDLSEPIVNWEQRASAFGRVLASAADEGSRPAEPTR